MTRPTISDVCKHHGETVFSYRNDGRYRCRKCTTVAVKKRRKELKRLSVQYKGGKCEKCGYDKCFGALQFHHLDPTKKDFGISTEGYTRSWEKVRVELDKCILVCANCHAEIHEELDNSFVTE